MIPRLFYLIFFLTFSLASAQFQFFENMFGHHQQQQQQQTRSGAAQYVAQVESVSCSKYLCPSTLDCVARPIDCPCPYEEDVKCIIPSAGTDDDSDDATMVCIRGEQGCSHVEQLIHKLLSRNS
ncbi:hypothetical protein AMATHDRAFT_142758 [Amanita thiersii Skay4041]|uniref:Long chronological lifespan protein 2 n=1 Tax=Amanita thiersii Skay4041 TaxID=703135 RepID=A0A2A9NMR2_9AGAR|nr:hypothetical protein AMATHDRAFT_142758 [Amanita thiersii Skay4041]